jgi:hypothetical protein
MNSEVLNMRGDPRANLLILLFGGIKWNENKKRRNSRHFYGVATERALI